MSEDDWSHQQTTTIRGKLGGGSQQSKVTDRRGKLAGRVEIVVCRRQLGCLAISTLMGLRGNRQISTLIWGESPRRTSSRNETLRRANGTFSPLSLGRNGRFTAVPTSFFSSLCWQSICPNERLYSRTAPNRIEFHSDIPSPSLTYYQPLLNRNAQMRISSDKS